MTHEVKTLEFASRRCIVCFFPVGKADICVSTATQMCKLLCCDLFYSGGTTEYVYWTEMNGSIEIEEVPLRLLLLDTTAGLGLR